VLAGGRCSRKMRESKKTARRNPRTEKT
jgi:hypothetical protein